MAQNWKNARADALATGRLDEATIAKHQHAMLAEVRAQKLAAIRETLGLNQSFVAERIGVSQSRISQLERGDLDRSELATIRAYLAALGGEIEVVARFGDERIRII